MSPALKHPSDSPSYEQLQARAITIDEREAMLSLMCRAFHIDPSAAKHVFYSDPFFDLSMKRALFNAQNGDLVSCLTLIPTAMRLSSGAVLPICGIAGVCTEPALRKNGYARFLIERTLAAMPSEIDYSLTALTAARPEYYESMGWTPCGASLVWTAPTSSLPRYAETDIVQMLSDAEETRRGGEIHNLYASLRGRNAAGTFVRDERRRRCIEKLTLGRRVAVVESGSGATAYIAYDVVVRGNRRILNVHEIVARNDTARRALIGFLATGPHGADRIEGRCSPPDASDLGLTAILGVKFEVEPSVYLRLSHLTILAQLVLAGKGAPAEMARLPQGLIIAVDSPPSAWTSNGRHSARVRAMGRRLSVKAAPSGQEDMPKIAGSAAGVTQLVLGVRSAAALVSDGSPQASSPTVIAACEGLFAPLQPFLAIPDVF